MLLSVSSCQKKLASEGLTSITYYPVITLEGGSVVMSVGATYSEPGYSALLNGEDVTKDVKVSDNIDNTTFGNYTVTYSIVNSDGFSSSTSRDVMVVNENSFANFYYSEVRNATGTRHYYDAPITIEELGNGNYEISDLIGGLYFYGIYPGYEPTYDFHAECEIALDSDNNITLIEEGDWYWYDPTNPLTIQVGTYYPDEGRVHLEVGFSGETSFYIDLVTPSAN